MSTRDQPSERMRAGLLLGVSTRASFQRNVLALQLEAVFKGVRLDPIEHEPVAIGMSSSIAGERVEMPAQQD